MPVCYIPTHKGSMAYEVPRAISVFVTIQREFIMHQLISFVYSYKFAQSHDTEINNKSKIINTTIISVEFNYLEIYFI